MMICITAVNNAFIFIFILFFISFISISIISIIIYLLNFLYKIHASMIPKILYNTTNHGYYS